MRGLVVLIHCWFGAIVVLALISLLGTLFWHPVWLLGAVAFVLIFATTVVVHGFSRRPLRIPESVLVPLLIAYFALFAITAALSGKRGAPKLGDAPVFATRSHYAFTREPAAEPWRFFTVATAFQLSWHGILLVFTANEWLSAVRRSNRYTPSRNAD